MSEGKELAPSQGVMIQGKRYSSIQTAINDLSQIQNPVERFEAQQAVLEDLESHSDNLLDGLELFYNWTMEDKAYESVALSKSDVLDIFKTQQQMVANNIDKRDRRKEALEYTHNAWKDSPRAMTWLEDQAQEKRGFFNATRKLARSTKTFTEAAARINVAIFTRLSTTEKGNRKVQKVVPQDLTNATRMMFKDKMLDMEIDISEDWLRESGMRVGRHGVLELNDGSPCMLMAPEGEHGDEGRGGGDEAENAEASTATRQDVESDTDSIYYSQNEDNYDFTAGNGKELLGEFGKNTTKRRQKSIPGAAPPNPDEVDALHQELMDVDPHYQELGIDPRHMIGSKRPAIDGSSSGIDETESRGGVLSSKRQKQSSGILNSFKPYYPKEPESGSATKVGGGSDTGGGEELPPNEANMETELGGEGEELPPNEANMETELGGGGEELPPNEANMETELELTNNQFKGAAPLIENPTGGVSKEDRDIQTVRTPKSKKKSKNENAFLENAEINCKCSSDVPVTWKMDCLRIGEKRERSLFKFLDQFAGFKRVCDLHTKECAGRLELTIISDLVELRGRINQIGHNKEKIGNMKKDSKTSAWWIPSARALNPEDLLVTTYRHMVVEKKKFKFPRPKLIKYLESEFKIQIDEKSWKEDGVAVLPVFKWLEKHPGLCKAMQEEFRMYRFHQQPWDNPQYNGVQKTQYYSIAQQFIRQDLVHYLCHVVMRDDRETRLVSFPYPCRYELDNEIIPEYYKLDIRISESAKKKHVKNYIHSSVSMAMKGKDGSKQKLEAATARETLISGFHKYIEQWSSSKIKAGVVEPDSPTQDMGPTLYDEEDVKRYGEWEEYDIEPGEVLFRLPTIPHSSEDREGEMSMVIYPKMVALQDDNETLEIPGIGTWSEISAWNSSMKAPITTTEAFADIPNLLPFRASAAITLDNIGPISDAIMCRKSWDTPEVINTRHQLLCTKAITQIVEDSRTRAISQAIVAYQNLRKAEKIEWGKESYYDLVDTNSESIDMFFSGTNPTPDDDDNPPLDENAPGLDSDVEDDGDFDGEPGGSGEDL